MKGTDISVKRYVKRKELSKDDVMYKVYADYIKMVKTKGCKSYTKVSTN